MDARYGKGSWEHEYMVFDTFVHLAQAPLQYVFSDFYKLHLFAVDEETRSKLKRLWLTVLIDAYSRCVVGFALLYVDPSIESIQDALRHGFFPKASHLEYDDLKDIPYACYGVFQHLFLDNAWCNHSESLKHLAKEIGDGIETPQMEVWLRPPYKSRTGALVERFFGNFSLKLAELMKGAIRSHDLKQVQTAMDDACFLYGDVLEFVHEMVLTYHHTVHGELGGLTPHQKWIQGMAGGRPLVPALTPAVERLFWHYSHDTRIKTGKGICLFGLHYSSAKLAKAAGGERDGASIKYGYAYRKGDISHIALFHNGKYLFDVYAKEFRQPDGTYKAVSLAEWELSKDIAKVNGGGAVDHLKSVNKWAARADKRTKEKIRIQRDMREKGKGGRTPPKPLDVAAAEEVVGMSTSAKEDREYTKLLAAWGAPSPN